jgi:hypothetical protein
MHIPIHPNLRTSELNKSRDLRVCVHVVAPLHGLTLDLAF